VSDVPARVRAHKLLVDNLTPAQREQLAKTDSFDVIGGDTGTRYRLLYRRTLNIERLGPNGQVEGLLCLVPKGALPTADQLLAQKIALELSREIAEAYRSRTFVFHHDGQWYDVRHLDEIEIHILAGLTG
jgi:hypothetical protein